MIPDGPIQSQHLAAALDVIERPRNYQRPGLVQESEEYHGFTLGPLGDLGLRHSWGVSMAKCLPLHIRRRV